MSGRFRSSGFQRRRRPGVLFPIPPPPWPQSVEYRPCWRPDQTVFDPEAAAKLPREQQNGFRADTWTDIPTVRFFKIDADELRGSALWMLKLLAHQDSTGQNQVSENANEPQQHNITILSESEIHITVRLSSGLQFTLTEAAGKPKTARIRSMRMMPSTPTPALLDTEPSLSSTTGADAWTFTPLTPSVSPSPSLNIHLTYQITTRPSSYGVLVSPSHTNLSLHPYRIRYIAFPPSPYLWFHSPAPYVPAFPAFPEHVPTPPTPRSTTAAHSLCLPQPPSSTHAAHLRNAHHLLLAASLLLEFESTPPHTFEDAFIASRLGNIQRDVEPGLWAGVPRRYGVGARTVVVESVAGPELPFGPWSRARCVRKWLWSVLTIASVGAEVVRGLAWLAWLVGEVGILEDSRCVFWNCGCNDAVYMRAVVKRNRPEEYEAYEEEAGLASRWVKATLNGFTLVQDEECKWQKSAEAMVTKQLNRGRAALHHIKDMYRHAQVGSINQLWKLYTTTVLSQFTYACEISAGISPDSERELDQFHREGVRFVMGVHCRTITTVLFKDFDTIDLSLRRSILALKYLQHAINAPHMQSTIEELLLQNKNSNAGGIGGTNHTPNGDKSKRQDGSEIPKSVAGIWKAQYIQLVRQRMERSETISRRFTTSGQGNSKTEDIRTQTRDRKEKISSESGKRMTVLPRMRSDGNRDSRRRETCGFGVSEMETLERGSTEEYVHPKNTRRRDKVYGNDDGSCKERSDGC
ncbi:hypothetical protein BJ508DRAFT_315917 [Ascobolus immersus RN42]|uniref:Uncharacterized protein n=1 Tax=Ascobolus immersus RN42 TaxID=1160509 RepID=A0A3N4HBC3_ASCIM|nr:hypothetical protein BJ508DRAFT_315917 [Ascobolus immersus RN42]